MASQGYRDWLNAGRPYTLIRPAKAVQATLRGYSLTVYDYPNDAHLQASTPEDHTPFSVTGWPGQNKRWKARALDVMPRKGVPVAQANKENADIARQLIRDRDAGVAGAMWIKYVNWTDEQGTCRQERWTDAAHPLARTTKASNDRGHIHISGRSDADDDSRADGYDPIARTQGAGGDDEMSENASRQVGAMFDMEDTVYLFTDGTGTKNPMPFSVPLVATLKALSAKVDIVAAALADFTSAIRAAGSVDGAPLVGELAAIRAAVEAQMSAAELAALKSS